MGLDIYFRHIKEKEGRDFRNMNILITFFENRYDLINGCPIKINYDDINELYNRCCKVLKNPELGPSLLPSFNELSTNTYLNNIEEIQEYCKELLPKFNQLKNNEYITFEIDY